MRPIPILLMVAAVLAATASTPAVAEVDEATRAGRFTFGPAAEPSAITTRVRVDDYTYLHAVAETADGKLYGVARFIKAAGGCSAPAGKDQALAMQRLRPMKLARQGP